MKLHELSPSEGSKKNKFRVGRGHGSGNGKTAEEKILAAGGKVEVI